MILVVIQIALAFQGFDVCDDGFVLTFYQQFFDNPESVEYNFLYWFTGLVGGLWYKFNESGGIFWFRILAIIVNTLTFIIAYRLLDKIFKNQVIILGLIIVLFANNFGFLTFYHNHLTAIFCVSIIFILFKALKKYNLPLFLLVGFMIGINVFVRLPNLTFATILLVIPYNHFLKFGLRFKFSLIKSIVVSLLGILLGFTIVFLLLIALGQLSIFKNAFLVLFDLGGTENSSHNLRDVIYAQYYNYKAILKAIVLMIISLWLYAITITKFPRNIFIFSMSFFLGLGFIYWIGCFGIYALYSMSIFGSCFFLFNKKSNIISKQIAFMGLILLLVIPLGTGGGVYNAGYMSIWIALPLFFLSLEPAIKLYFKTFKVLADNKIKVHYLSIIIIGISFTVYKSYKIFNEAYFDPGSRMLKTYSINSDLANNIYTTQERAEIINMVLKELHTHTSKGDFLFIYDNMPMLNFLTQTKPFAYNSWPFIYDHNSFRKKIKKAESKVDKLPVVVQQKFSTIFEFSEPKEDYMSENTQNTLFHNNNLTAVMNDFLQRNNYEVIWSNEYFNIYKPRKE